VYIGKAEDSLLARDGRTHFTEGRTGQSTLRRSIAALLRDRLDLAAQARNPDEPGRFYAYGLDAQSERRLQHWMGKRLKISAWPKPDGVDLSDVERALLKRWKPPLNLKDNPQKWAELSAKRQVMADDAEARSLRP
jgi:hypothetical protein